MKQSETKKEVLKGQFSSKFVLIFKLIVFSNNKSFGMSLNSMIELSLRWLYVTIILSFQSYTLECFCYACAHFLMKLPLLFKIPQSEGQN